MLTGLLHRTYLTHFSRPASDRRIYREIARRRMQRILEVGVGDGLRAERMIAVCRRRHRPEEIEYTGIDKFETRSPDDVPGLSLKEAYRLLRVSKARVRLVPGDPLSALSRAANEIPRVDLILIRADPRADEMAQAWFFLPRLLHQGTAIHARRPGGDHLGEWLSQAEVRRRADSTIPRAAA